ncbi:hypothetical protein [Flavobacterium psychrotrophum]|uniref:hypothetical protein n=1 Tax=Flavobacterium psychrotrophum TaxID=2294119 RepID=UPI000E30F71A|nr:hypothetical protein [Flavobacterium psychrotrophum]
MDKITKLNELSVLLKTGAITATEFEILKKEAIAAPIEKTIIRNIASKPTTHDEKSFEDEQIHIDYEDDGFNHPWYAILSVLCSGLTLYMIMISPVMIFIFGWGSFLLGISLSVTVLNKLNATKLDKTLAYLAIMLSILSGFIFLTWKPS